MLTCPICEAGLQREDRSTVTVDVCPQHGLWLDRSELLAITEAERHAMGTFVWADIFRRPVTPPSDRHRTLMCPSCDSPMRLEFYHEVTIDWCPHHGVWLDNGELDAIINNLRLDPTYLRGMALRISESRF